MSAGDCVFLFQKETIFAAVAVTACVVSPI